MWLSLRSGFANTAAIAALALLPLVTFASAMLNNASEQARVDNDPVRIDQILSQSEPLLAHFAE
jgi:Na+-translocating ferredoxin:NAD+ oxidoreductase RNF subunit RnfB